MFRKNFLKIVLLILPLFFILSCQEALHLLQQVKVKTPKASVENVKLTDLSLSKADLLFDIAVENPNPLGIHLSGMDYNLLIAGASFIKGQKQDKLDIKANGKARVSIPLSLTYSEIHKAVKSFADLDTVPYQLKLKIGVNLPVLGDIKIPVSKTGSFPNLQLPEISLKGIKLDKIGFSGADLKFMIAIKNPNALNFVTSNLNYDLEVNGTNWIRGKIDKAVKIKKKAKQTVSIPVTLNFLEMGSAVYQMLSGDSKLEYHLKGKSDFSSDFKLLKNFSLPFDKKGKIDLTK